MYEWIKSDRSLEIQAIESRSRTVIGSGSSHLLERIIEIVGATKVYEPPITTGNLVPNQFCSRVFNPATNSRVWITCAFSSWENQASTGMYTYEKSNKNHILLNWILATLLTYRSSSHLRNQSSRYDDCRPEHYKIMLKSKKDSLRCKTNEQKSWNSNKPTTQQTRGGNLTIITAKRH